MLVKDFDFHLPPELIAQKPLERRDDSRMMVVRREEGTFRHAAFRDFPDYLEASSLLVLNDTKVIPAKVWGHRSGALVEFLLFKQREPGTWEVLCRPARKIRTGDRVDFPGGLTADVVESGDEGHRVLRFGVPDVLGYLREIGFAPLPPYIKRPKNDASGRAEDLARYQTLFAEKEGAIAAPTAGLHFTPEVLGRLSERGVKTARVTLQVGLATFQPMRAKRIEDHRMLEEIYTISEEAAGAVTRAKAEGRPVVAVGTTVVRTLESAARVGLEGAERGAGGGQDGGENQAELAAARSIVSPGTRGTSMFIYPGFEFKVVDRLLTNFHLPQSTLLMLASAFAGRELILAAYEDAVREKYRFFSYGDCMLIL
ncbi:MAG: tRNA preQ1(34) S-adenosylmethionine ribosyltransferase-isomerase QueA [Candidatus Aminicenantes bacterium]|nr:tRNA preQ1(34) S-adenosylmethionine ribosyltransferase-isomerase QueA [Candidatus Aminicenantes bacterium]